MKDHEIAQLVNDLRDIAVTYGQTQQLRQRIHDLIVPVLQTQEARIDFLEGKVAGLQDRLDTRPKVRYMSPDSRTWTAAQHAAFGLMADECRTSLLYPEGDAILIWVNQGDILRDGELMSWKNPDLKIKNNDTARLNWIEQQGDEFNCGQNEHEPDACRFFVMSKGGYHQGKTLRDTIDKAMGK